MRKFFLFIGAMMLAVTSLQASERVVWSGNQPISWNQSKYTGITQLLVKNFDDLQEGEVIKVYTTPKIASSDVQHQLKHITSDYSWTDITGPTAVNGVVCYTPSSSSILTDIVERGLIITGQGYDLTKITIASANGEATIAKYDSVQISWATGGFQFVTKNYVPVPSFSSVRQNSTIRIYTEPVGSNPNYQLRYLSKDSKRISVTPTLYDNAMVYTVPTEAISDSIRAKGLVITGIHYAVNRISIQDNRVFNMCDGDSTLTWWPYVCYMDKYISDIALNDTIVVTVKSREDGKDIWAQLRVCTENGTVGHYVPFTLYSDPVGDFPKEYKVVVDESFLANLASDNHLYLAGAQAVVSKVELRKKDTFVPTETTIWTANGKGISWNSEIYTGEQFNTKPIWDQPDLVGLENVAVGDILTFHVTAGQDNPTYQIDHKRGDGWSWTKINEDVNTDNAPTTTGAKGYFTYTVSDSTFATIPTRGIVFTGIGYNIDFITRTIPASNLTLNDNVNESTKLSRLQALDGSANITINRTLYKDGYYNTLCLPFDVPTLSGTPLEGATVRAFESAEVVGDMVYVTINDAQSLSAGVPYLVRFEEGEDINAMTFNDVTVTATSGGATESTVMNFNGILQPTELTASEDYLFLGANNTLYWPETDAELKGFRAYFKVNTGAGAPPRGMRACLHEGPVSNPTSVENTFIDCAVEKRIENGQIIIIKDGIQYNILGQRQ